MTLEFGKNFTHIRSYETGAIQLVDFTMRFAYTKLHHSPISYISKKISTRKSKFTYMSKQYDRLNFDLVAAGLPSHDAFTLDTICASTEWAFVSDLKVSLTLRFVSYKVNGHVN